jgi:hypothetical protein
MSGIPSKKGKTEPPANKNKLNLKLIDGIFAICRFNSDCQPPDWLWQSQSFYSLTKTDQELSLVCDQSIIPKEILDNSNDTLCETDWGLFQVQGPLDFALTGILNRLTRPLAQKGISLFAVSTYDTDYILVKQDCVLMLDMRGSWRVIL